MKRNFLNIRCRELYSSLKSQYNRVFESTHKNYLIKVKAEIRRDAKQFWKYINSKRNNDGLPNSLSYKDKSSTDETEISDMFVDFFQSVYNPVFSGCDNFFDSTSQSQTPVLYVKCFSRDEVLHGINGLKYSHSHGPDGIPSSILKNCRDSLCDLITFLFNLSLKTNEFPEFWKASYIFPLFKSGRKKDIKNYRGISKISVLPKMFESLFMPYISNHLKIVIDESQHGFRKCKSIESNLLEQVSFIYSGFKINKQVDVLYTDFSKAFDKVDHLILCDRLYLYGFSADLVQWIKSYLLNRKQHVKFKNIISKAIHATSGVPQGSHLGPSLFLIFIDPLSRLLKNCKCLMFADDAKFSRIIDSDLDCIQLQNDINLLGSWCLQNHLDLNVDKCKIISFRRNNKSISFNYSINNCDIERVSHIKDLGVFLDTKLTFNLHIDHIVNISRQRLTLIKGFAKEFNDVFITKQLFVSLVRSVLEFASIVWCPTNIGDINRIESVQKQFLLFVLNHLNWSDPYILPPYTSRLNLVAMDTLENRRKAGNATWILKLLRGEIDSPSLLQKLRISVPRTSRTYTGFLRMEFDTRSFILQQPFLNIIKDFNDAYPYINFENSIYVNKSKILCFLRNSL